MYRGVPLHSCNIDLDLKSEDDLWVTWLNNLSAWMTLTKVCLYRIQILALFYLFPSQNLQGFFFTWRNTEQDQPPFTKSQSQLNAH